MGAKPKNLEVSRRRFFRNAMTLIAAPAGMSAISCAAAAQPQPPDGAEQLTHYQEAEMGGREHGPLIWLRWNNMPLTSYRAQEKQKFPYFYPLVGPLSGLPMTSESALPYPHHRSLYFGCDHLNNANFWQGGLEAGQVISEGPRVKKASATSAVIQDTCKWVVPGRPVQMTDERTYTILANMPHHWIIDTEIKWNAVEDVEIQKTNHGLFALRCAVDISPRGGGTLINSEGDRGEKNTFGKPASWCAYYGKRVQAKNEPIEGIALFEHPENPWNPCPWFTRDYGFISSTPFNFIKEPWRLPAGQSVTLKYRVVVFAGDPVEAGLDALHAQWVNA
ncbi:MAG: PmoA family protein [Candidatus Hydrogenedentes bacterium]|nr:PmoA family protein [Candidatus Hydrogenedentota bacterium]